MSGPARKHAALRGRLSAAAVSLASALVLAAVAPLALAATGPVGGGTTHSSYPAHRGKCARHARRHGSRHRRCPARRRVAPKKAPAPALALVPPAGPTAQPVNPAAALPAPVVPAASVPASEGVTPGPGGGETGESGEPGEPPSVPHVQVSAVEYAFTLSRTTVPAGKVIFQFVNNGQDEHNLQIAPPEGPLAGFFANTPSKGIGDLALEMQPGTYTLLCSLPTHEQKGMKATLTVE